MPNHPNTRWRLADEKYTVEMFVVAVDVDEGDVHAGQTGRGAPWNVGTLESRMGCYGMCRELD